MGISCNNHFNSLNLYNPTSDYPNFLNQIASYIYLANLNIGAYAVSDLDLQNDFILS